MPVNRVLIVGGGIGGLTTAVSLRQRGIDVDIVESNPEWSVYGVGITQPSNMLRALAQLGLGDRCVELGADFPGWQIHDADGRRLGNVPLETVAGPNYPASNGIVRPVLHKILREATLQQGAKVRLGITVSAWSEDDQVVHVSFTDGTTAYYDLVIGADGAHSEMRRRVIDPGLRPQLTGQSVWRYNFRRLPDLSWAALYYGARSKAGLVPLSHDLMYLLLVTMEPGNPRMPKNELHTLLRERLAEYGGPIAELSAQITDPGGVVYRPVESLLVPPPWHRGRVLLIGDAAHTGSPHLAQGAAMAIEDAVLLGDMLSEPQDLAETLPRFTDRRMPRCRLVVETGLQMGEWEMLQWQGRPAANMDHGALMHRALSELMRPI